MLNRILLKRKLSTLKQKLTQKSTQKMLFRIVALLSLFLVRAALASSSNDIDLAPLDDSVEGHIQGDWGKLVVYVAIGLGIYLAAVKQTYVVLIGSFVILLFIDFAPGIVDSSLPG